MNMIQINGDQFNETRLRGKLTEFAVHPGLHDGLILYVFHRLPPGGFLMAVLCNDLTQAVARGGGLESSEKSIIPIVKFLVSWAPSGCWGSVEAVESWLRGRGETNERSFI